jgi:hypothetical protein
VNKLLLILLPLGLLPAQTARPQERAVTTRFALSRLNDAIPRLGGQTGTQDKVFARVMAGNGWETDLVVVNRGAGPVAFKQWFLDATGSPSPFTVSAQPGLGTVTTSAVQGTLIPNTVFRVVLSASGSHLQQGWSLLSYDESQGTLGGYAVIRHRGPGGGFNFETTIPLSSMQEFSAYLPFDNTLGFRTELTLVNPAYNLGAQVTLTYRNSQGQVVLVDSISLKTGQQMTIVLPDSYPDLANAVGTMNIEADINVLSVVGLRYNDAYGVIAALPTMN